MDQTQAIASLVKQVVENVALISGIAATPTYAAVELLKKAFLPSRWAGIASWVIGFLFAILVSGIVTHDYWNPMAILSGILVGTGVAGVYSATKAAVGAKAAVN